MRQGEHQFSEPFPIRNEGTAPDNLPRGFGSPVFGGGRLTSQEAPVTLCLLLSGDVGENLERIMVRSHLTLIGRSGECDIRMVGETVSRVHCAIRRVSTGYLLEDRSRNGTWINGLLRDGDTIRIGPHQLQVELTTARSTGMLPARETGSAPLRSVSRTLRRTPQLFVRGLEDGVTLCLTTERITIGRRPGNDLLLEGAKISRDHAEIWREGESFWLIDLGSANGTLVNGEKIGRAQLANADQVRIGNYDCLVSFRDEDCLLHFRRRTS